MTESEFNKLVDETNDKEKYGLNHTTVPYTPEEEKNIIELRKKQEKEDKKVSKKVSDILERQAPEKTKAELQEARETEAKAKDQGLLKLIHAELDKDHLLDHKEKMAVFLICCSSFLADSKDRKSCALKGNSSAGKDNIIDTCLKHIPSDEWIKVTRATQSTLEEDISKNRIIAFSEMNKHRENGANSDIVEILKQLAEGGSHALKKDIKTGFKTAMKIKQEQKSVLYGTTEAEIDEELETRFVVIGIKGYPVKNELVVNNYLKSISDIDSYFINQKESWIKKMLSSFDDQLNVIIPYASELSKEVDGKHIFDNQKERIKRDVKRLMSLTKTIAWLHQKQRVIQEKKGLKFLMAEPSDFLNAINIFADFFNLTYSGLDHRTQNVLDYVSEHEGKHESDILTFGFDPKYYNWVLRHKAQEDLGIESTNTIKKYVAELKDKGKIETHYDPSIPRGYLLRGCQEGINSPSLPISVTALDTLLTGWLTPYNITKVYTDKEINPFLLNFTAFFEKLTPSKLTPSICKKTLCEKNNESGEKALHDSNYLLDNEERLGDDI